VLPDDQVLIDALRDHATTLEQTTSRDNDSHDRDIAEVEAARALAFKIENGNASEEEKRSVAEMVHASVKTHYKL
jgi:hypothetical protein